MPTIIDWPTSRPFVAATFRFGLQVSEAVFRGVYTRNTTSRNNLADRMTCVVTLAPCRDRDDQGQVEGYLFQLRSQRPWMRFGIPHRPHPRGTLRGTPTATSGAAAGATSLAITTTAGATMRAGDFLGYGSNHMLQAGINGATANGSGAMTLPLAFPLPVAISSSAALTWDNPKALWEFDGDGMEIDYSPGLIQQGATIPFLQAINA